MFSQNRKVIPYNSGWSFVKDSSNNLSSIVNLNKPWQKVRIPHTWNAYDVMDDTPGYYRGTGVYKNTIHLNDLSVGKRIFLQFEAAGQEAQLLINRQQIKDHKGGYTQFIAEIGPFLQKGKDNEVILIVTNKFNENLPPLSADFTFFGGLYRKIAIIETSETYFEDHNFGANGIYITTPKVDSSQAKVNVVAQIKNSSNQQKELKLRNAIYSREGIEISFSETRILLKQNETKRFEQALEVKNPRLWSPQSPNLYRLKTQLIDSDGNVLDEINNPLAFRWYFFNEDKVFLLNGKPLKLIGASRHQDFKNMGNAVPDDLQIEDVSLLKEMGGNFLRVAHYPQTKSVLEACDSLGIITSIEIPIVNEITESEEFTQNSLHMQQEMIRQYYNHPSVVIWGYMNEVLLRPKFNNNKERQKIYFENIRILAQKLENLTKKEDPSRFTMIAHHGNFNLYNQVGLNHISDIVGWNLYPGWYGGKIEDFGRQLDQIHKDLKEKPLLVTEYGADVDPRINVANPIRFDKSIEYGIAYHQGYIKDILSRPFVAGAMAWNLADFSSETREETMPHINNKGLLTLDRQAKDTYWLYRTRFNDKPIVKISNWINRATVSDTNFSVQSINVYSNLNKLELFVNDKTVEAATVNDNIANWKTTLLNGKNKVLVRGYSNGGQLFADSTTIVLNLLPASLKSYDFRKPLLMSFGDTRSYTDTLGYVWLPEKEFAFGSWGYVGGKALFRENAPRQKYGVDKNIIGTEEDPLYQTQRMGLNKLIFDVPRGTYHIEFLFAEFNDEQTKLLYNLTGNENQDEKWNLSENLFDIKINGKRVIRDLNVAKESGYFTALQKSITAKSKAKGLIIEFDAQKGEPLINAIKISKIK
ncbi:glycoside hydrolase family 2 TIM barrel-domain containing protein [Pseudopedobacter saltans]|uniref:glycoside hydrolase family 2 TIM barrel-domain containing protein n=1 Tax=Pseudopedobacter saltans TaxID=151895 RepID=UPI00145D43AC|nr:glycoside hydrolase family 2 TIM barrel-domain containing protein [Pseudopedobacter saltans]